MGEEEYAGIISVDALYVEVGSPPQHPAADGYVPMSALEAIRARHIAGFEAEIERLLSDASPDVVAHLVEPVQVPVEESYNTPGLAGGILPGGYVAFIYRPMHADGTALEYDNDLDRLAQRTGIPGVKPYGIRLSGHDIEVLPNERSTVYCYCVTRSNALAGVLPGQTERINTAILRDGRAAVLEARGGKEAIRRQSRETQP